MQRAARGNMCECVLLVVTLCVLAILATIPIGLLGLGLASVGVIWGKEGLKTAIGILGLTFLFILVQCIWSICRDGGRRGGDPNATSHQRAAQFLRTWLQQGHTLERPVEEGKFIEEMIQWFASEWEEARPIGFDKFGPHDATKATLIRRIREAANGGRNGWRIEADGTSKLLRLSTLLDGHEARFPNCKACARGAEAESEEIGGQ